MNLEPTDYESAALTVELWARFEINAVSKNRVTAFREITSRPQFSDKVSVGSFCGTASTSTRVAAKAVKRLEFATGENAAGALGKIRPAGLLLREQLGSSSSAIRPVKPDEADLESVAGHVTPQYPLVPITLEKGKVDAM